MPAGKVAFFLEGSTKPLGTGKLKTSKGVTTATYSTTAIGGGSHAITARYYGDGNKYLGSSATAAQDVRGAVSVDTLLTREEAPGLTGAISAAWVTRKVASATVLVGGQ